MDKNKNALHTSRFPKPNERLGSYLLENLIDEDKSGSVFKAMDENLARPVYVRVLSSELTKNPSFMDVLRIQMQAAVTLNEPGIVPLYEIGETGGFIFIATEWSSRGWLSQEIAENGKYSLSESLELIMQCAETLKSASDIKIFHGNLRLNSIALYPGGKVKISEIGFCAAVRALYGPSNLQLYLGAARFLAPEMTLSGSVDHRADIYSLGLILYYLLFTVTPFRYEGDNLAGESPAVETEYMDQVLKIVTKMTENSPDSRYQNYDSLLADLHQLYSKSAPPLRIPVVKNRLGEVIKNQKLFKLLSVVYASSISGALQVREDDAIRTFLIRNREIIYYESNQTEENIWQWLVEKREIDPRHLPPPEEPFQRTMTRMFSKGLIRLEDFKFRYQELVNRQLADLLKKPSAHSEFASAEIDGEPMCAVRLASLLLKAARYTVSFKDVMSDIKSESFLDRTGLFDHLVTGFQLTDEENLLVQVSQDGIYTGPLNVNEGSSAEKGLRFLYLLKQIGALDLRSTVAVGSAEPVPDFSPEVRKLLPEEFQMEEEPSDPRESGEVRMEIQRTAGKIDRDRLDMEAERRYEKAKEFYRNGKYWEASHQCEQALGLHEDGRYYWLMGLSYSQHPRFRHKAEDSFHRALRLDPLNDELHTDLANFYFTQGLFLRARSHCLKALQIIPEQERAREILSDHAFDKLGPGGCCCEHDPGCNHEEHKAWRR